MRSEIYSLGIFPFHWNVTAWPIVFLPSLLAACILYLVVRSFSARSFAPRRTVPIFLSLTAFLSLTTSLAWYTCLIMPDILGPILYLCLFLLVFARATLSTRERFAVAAIAAWSMAAHSTHLMLAVGILLWLALLLLLRFPPIRLRPLAGIAALIAIVVAAQFALHDFLYGKPSLYGNHMPYLTARIVADGPGRWYLQQHCATLNWAICTRVADLPSTDDEFLWADGGVWDAASPAQQQQMLQQEMPLVLAAVREYPRAQFQRSLANFWQELLDFGLWDLVPNDWMSSQLNTVLPGALPTYQRTRQARRLLPTEFFSSLQLWVVAASALAIAVSVPFLWLRRRWQVLGLIAILVPTVIANAFVTAVLAEADSRYQSRIIWLIPLAALLIALDLLTRRVTIATAMVSVP